MIISDHRIHDGVEFDGTIERGRGNRLQVEAEKEVVEGRVEVFHAIEARRGGRDGCAVRFSVALQLVFDHQCGTT